ncbi:hypothetical protein [Streptomyces sp. NPDC048192]
MQDLNGLHVDAGRKGQRGGAVAQVWSRIGGRPSFWTNRLKTCERYSGW